MRDFYEENRVDLFRFWKEDFPKMIVPQPPTSYPPEPSKNSSLLNNNIISVKDIRRAVEESRRYLRRYIQDDESWSFVANIIDKYVAEKEGMS